MPYPVDDSQDRGVLTFLLLAIMAIGALLVRRRYRVVSNV
ncbi:hypothetical protein HNQ60_000705 [Povalibacter uvarum]|uniref:Uncharacterized protein n=1 Tax=Povalibacter uvarum TaxID=732238 RepID=A0A841HHH4_9GAMM|nr:hypothetical protein [Povalibacter uvarum]